MITSKALLLFLMIYSQAPNWTYTSVALFQAFPSPNRSISENGEKSSIKLSSMIYRLVKEFSIFCQIKIIF